MKAEALAASIISDAKKKAREIEKAAENEEKEIRAETDRVVKKKQKELSEQEKKRVEQEKLKQETQRQRDASLALLEFKQTAIEETFTEAQAHLAKLTGAERAAFLEKLLERAKKEISVQSVVAAKKDEEFLRGKTNVSSTVSCEGGFIASDGNVSLDLRFETIIETLKERKVKEIADILFKEEDDE